VQIKQVCREEFQDVEEALTFINTLYKDEIVSISDTWVGDSPRIVVYFYGVKE